MKNILYYLVFTILISCNSNEDKAHLSAQNQFINQEIDSQEDTTSTNELDTVILDLPEDFDNFFHNFMLNEKFQLERIHFPLEFNYWGDGFVEETKFIQKEKWKHESFYLNQEYVPQIYDNLEAQLDDTNERLFMWHGVENGIMVSFSFKRIKGRWYLIKKSDFST